MTVDASTPALRLEVDLRPRVNFAVQQNAVPVIHGLRLSNGGPARLDDLEIRVTTDPAVSAPWTARVAALDPGQVFALDELDLPLSATALVQQNERQTGALCVEVVGPDGALLTERRALEVLAYNEWAGVGSLPELLAAFVQPNHPGVARLLQAARSRLEQATGDPSLDGYQSRDPRRVAAIAEAIYASIGACGVTYVHPPASFEQTGQKVRTPDQLLDDQMGTCLDLAVVLAAALEQAGLHALILVVQGHAFPGVWLTEYRLPQPTLDDPLPLRKRVELGETLVFDSSSAAARAPFARAVRVARAHLDDADRFLFAVDVAAARTARIRPLPMRLRTDAGFQLLADRAPEPSDPDAPPPFALPELPKAVELPSAADASPRSRLDRWKSRLLDLSLRNRLLNFRPTRRVLPLMAPDLGALEDALSRGRPFEILPRPRTLEEEGRSARVHEERTGEDVERALLLDALDHGRLHVDLAPRELEDRVVELYRSARSSMEESGAITLYLSLGMLRWYESPSSETPREAPLLLLPAEIVRGSVTEPYRLRLADEEARVNVTLLQKLQKDFGMAVAGLDELPEDDMGLDVAAILDRFRRLVRDVPRWEVVPTAWLGEFSFTKFLMWLDLEARTDALLQNRVVKHLFEGEGQPFPLARPFSTPEQLDGERPAAEDLCVVDADSSQRAAVFGAIDGNSFVLQGPPGTGKSQTITNLIAGALARGRTVLFVSEKMAALDVVHDRLGRVGLGPFCLEAHSNKASRSSIVRQLGVPFTLARQRDASGWAALADRLAALRGDLNAYVEAMHRPGPFGESPFEATSRLIGLRDAPRVPVEGANPDRETLEHMRRAVGALSLAAADVGTPDRHPLAPVGRTEWDPRFGRRAEEALAEARSSLAELRAKAGEAADCVGAGAPDGLAAARRLAHLAGILLESPAPPRALVEGGGWPERRARVEVLVGHATRRARLWAELAPGWHDGLLELDLDAMRERYTRWGGTFFLFAFFFLWSARRMLRPVRREGAVPPDAEVKGALDTALAVRDEDRALATADAEARALLGRAWRSAATDPDEVTRILDWTERLRSALLDLRDRGDLADDGACLRLATDGAELLRPERRAGAVLTALSRAHARWRDAWAGLVELLQLDGLDADGFEALDTALGAMEGALPGLRHWCAWRRAAADVRSLGLGALVDAHFRGELDRGVLGATLERSIREEWIEEIMATDARLRNFRGQDHEARIAEFRDLDDRSHAVAREEVVARVLSRVPDLDAPGEMAVLRRELRKKRAHKPIRKLFSEIPTTLLRVKPCVLMSPLSVAQYLDPALDAFDLVVFDEASQIPPWDAVGAIARGRSVVVVGDSKQLPPTSFFDRGDDEEALDDEDQFDLESILDDCVAAGLPTHSLRWHYRSRHEALIAFSNHHYYDRRLHTFPAAQAEVPHLGVKWRAVDGFYDKGRSRTNRAEAEAVVAEIVARLTDPARRHQSLGVVTFSQPQQRLIEDLLDEARRERPEIERFFGEQVEEPVFVKNLENVQGDERDVMLFSICYGPDAQGRISMNFGPLNRQGGERRLNVAITRARELLVVFSTLTADRIDLSRTRAVGVRHLKTFLDYAMRGQVAIDEAATVDPDAGSDSPFEVDVAAALEARGHVVHRQVGCSGYRIDLAVVDPDRPGAYLLAIECDGATYHSARCARDRDRIRQSVLEGLGWRFHRIWSTDWWLDRDAQIERAVAAIERAKQERAATPPPPPPSAPAPQREETAELVLPPETAGPRWPSEAAAYRRLPCPTLGTQEAFESAAAVPRIAARLAQVVRAEGPLSVDEAARRVAECWGVPRITARIRRRVIDAAKRSTDRPVERDGFLWPADLDPSTWLGFRHADGGDARSADEVPLEEIANVAAWIVGRAVVIDRSELAREVARVFGITRMGARVATRMDEGIALLERQGRAVVQDQSVREPAR